MASKFLSFFGVESTEGLTQAAGELERGGFFIVSVHFGELHLTPDARCLSSDV